jgi:hypothetical protein
MRLEGFQRRLELTLRIDQELGRCDDDVTLLQTL